jgi:hypothetical protein
MMAHSQKWLCHQLRFMKCLQMLKETVELPVENGKLFAVGICRNAVTIRAI